MTGVASGILNELGELAQAIGPAIPRVGPAIVFLGTVSKLLAKRLDHGETPEQILANITLAPKTLNLHG